MQADGGFFNQVQVSGQFPAFHQGVPADAPALDEFRHQLEPLGFPAGKRVGGLPQRQITQAGFRQQFEGVRNAGLAFKKFRRFRKVHLEHVRNGLPLVPHGQGGGVVALAPAGLARHIAGGQEVHFQLLHARALAGFTVALPRIEGETAAVKAQPAGIRRLREQGPDVVQETHVGGRGGTGRFADGALVHAVHHADGVKAGRGFP